VLGLIQAADAIRSWFRLQHNAETKKQFSLLAEKNKKNVGALPMSGGLGVAPRLALGASSKNYGRTKIR